MSISISFFQRSSKREKEDRNGHHSKANKKGKLVNFRKRLSQSYQMTQLKALRRPQLYALRISEIETLKGHFRTTLEKGKKNHSLKNPAKFIICFFAMLLNAISAKLFAKSYSLENYLISTRNLLCAINWHYKRLRQSFS